MRPLFIPGFMADRALWDRMLPFLDISEAPLFGDLSMGSSIEAMAQQALYTTPPTFSLIGFSMGGYVAREMARAAPERVKSLVLIATSARADTPEQTRRKASAAQQLGSIGFNGLSRRSIQASVHPDRAGDEDLLSRIRDMGVRLGKDAFIRQSTIARHDDLALLPQIKCPTLVVAAAQDQLRSLEEAAELEKLIPNAELAVIQGSGHMLPMEEPQALGLTISDWLRRHP